MNCKITLQVNVFSSARNYAIFAGGTCYEPNGFYSSQVSMYNIATNTWSVASLYQARYTIAATSVGNLALFAGGNLYSG